MTHGDRGCLERIAAWIGIHVDARQTRQLEQYVGWLSDEGSKLGGVGPREATRLWERHVCDSLAFGLGMAGTESLVDVGSGVGLPGIPLAVAFPGTSVSLLERSGRRADALHRVSAILGVQLNVIEADASSWDGSAARVTFRASLPVVDAATVAARILEPGGEAWFGLGRGAAPEALSAYREVSETVGAILTVDEVWVPPEILDSGVWLLRMTLP